jgi:hypothetical protein
VRKPTLLGCRPHPASTKVAHAQRYGKGVDKAFNRDGRPCQIFRLMGPHLCGGCRGGGQRFHEGGPNAIGRSIPESLEPLRRKLGAAHGVLDILVSEVGLQGSGIVALVRQREPAGMASADGP